MGYYNELRRLGININMHKNKQKTICPQCGGGPKKEKSLFVVVNDGAYKCYRAKCGWQGSAKFVKKEYSIPKQVEEVKQKETLNRFALEFFKSRGISKATLEKLFISSEGETITFNYYRNSRLVNYKKRIQDNGGKKTFRQHSNAEHILYNLDSLTGKTKAVIVEGEMDVLSIVEAGLDLKQFGIVSVDQGAGQEGSDLSGKLECLENCAFELDKIEEFYLFCDDDGPGKWLEKELVRRFGIHRCKKVVLPKLPTKDGTKLKDANDVLCKIDYITEKQKKEELVKAILEAKPVPYSGIIRLDRDMKEMLLEYYENGRPLGHTTYNPDLDKCITFLPTEMTLFSGYPGDGKSQFLRNQAMTQTLYRGTKWGVYVPEDNPADYFYEDLCHILIGKTMDMKSTNRMSREELAEAMDFIEKYFFFIYPEKDSSTGAIELPTNEYINKRLNFLKLRYGVDSYIKDPWNKIMHNKRGMRDDEYLAEELSREKFFAADFNMCFYVAHPNKPSGKLTRKDGTMDYIAPTPFDLNGGAMWFNGMDNIVIIFRPNRYTDAMDRTIEAKIMKIKKKKIVGREGSVFMDFDIKSSRYLSGGGNFLIDPLDIKNYKDYKPIQDFHFIGGGSDLFANTSEFVETTNEDDDFWNIDNKNDILIDQPPPPDMNEEADDDLPF